MDLSQATQMLTWLDEQHRQDRRELEELREQVKKQAEHIADLNKRLEESEGYSLQAQTQLRLLSRLEEAVEQVKGDVTMMLRDREEEWKKQFDADAQSRRADQERLSRSLSEITKEIRDLWKADLSAQVSELNRLAEGLVRLRSQVEDMSEKARMVPDKLHVLEVQMGQLTDDRQRTMELSKRVDQQAAKISALEERDQRTSQLWADLAGFREQMERELSGLAEQQRVSNKRQEKRLRSWAEEVERLLQKIQVWESDQKRHAACYEESERMLAGLKELERQISLRMDELAEVQRLGAERLNDQLGDMNAAQEKRWHAHQQETELAHKQRIGAEDNLRADLDRIEAELKAYTSQMDEARQAFGKLFLEISDVSEAIVGASGATTAPRRSRRRKKPSKAETAVAAATDVRIVEGDED